LFFGQEFNFLDIKIFARLRWKKKGIMESWNNGILMPRFLRDSIIP
jgi:hypothetical protein